ncbi:MAG: ABC transporter substrate-binding protein [Hoeflea sp.]|uniref:heme/hemin ABC transporter substrate-binding protein n=1 Tax=Hoeflea sp. TaxID=1940281 RepID=UPI001D7EB04F|nr:ABC transporter substrate-binding protein [Hoeflea sp.]MBU4531896.1 ABC transporter substrate-binding protein [Alphaproteobacteria bacterium]MBU4546318.1 ABC transporter substrate-binding protein [Alphaproteobacteria bacterium]MBU4549447.1 ABC transporter substrate-binding protein [Alphaproteobacteria bacterium]MBV1722622.1 ABC transporter substrate-binding protein [Hoeflea sp.]MBV1782560.1 ABC transporter substrate-binding protein [Hoeflea sp.]
MSAVVRLNRRQLILSAVAITAYVCTGWTAVAARAEEPNRIVVIGGSLTEIVYALGEEDRLIARDSTSLFPDAARELPDVGYIRQLSPEGVLSVNPDMILALEGFGPPEAASVISQAGIPVIVIPDGYDSNSIIEKTRATGKALGREQAGEALAEKVGADLMAAETAAAGIADKRKVLFLLSIEGGRLLAAGSETHAAGIVALAGGVNAMTGFSGYKEVSNEAVIEAAPDVILRMRSGRDPSSDAEVLAHPAIAATPAGKAGRVVGMDGLFILGYGPRTAQAARELGQFLYSDVAAPGN